MGEAHGQRWETPGPVLGAARDVEVPRAPPVAVHAPATARAARELAGNGRRCHAGEAGPRAARRPAQAERWRQRPISGGGGGGHPGGDGAAGTAALPEADEAGQTHWNLVAIFAMYLEYWFSSRARLPSRYVHAYTFWNGGNIDARSWVYNQ